MRIKLKILGKERILEGYDFLFLQKPEDCEETGIYCGLKLENWKDESFLKIIAKKGGKDEVSKM